MDSPVTLDSGRPANSPKSRPNRPTAYREAKQLQELILAKAKDPEVKGAVLSGLARAYKELEELKLRLRMKPAPKAIDVQHYRPKSRKSATNDTGATE